MPCLTGNKKILTEWLVIWDERDDYRRKSCFRFPSSKDHILGSDQSGNGINLSKQSIRESIKY